MVGDVFFKGEFLLEDIFCNVFADEAEVPWFVGVAGDVFFAFGVAEDEAVFREFFVNFGESFAVSNHFVVVAFDRAVGLDDENVDGKAGVVFGVADFGEVLFAIFRSEFWVSRPSVPNFLLFFERAVSAVEFNLDTFGEEFLTEHVEMHQGDFFDEKTFAERIGGFDQFDVVEPVVGELVLLVDDGEVRVEVAEFGFDVGRGNIVFRRYVQTEKNEQKTDDQRNKPFHVRCTPSSIDSFIIP